MPTADRIPELTALLSAWKGGDRSVEQRLVACIYPVLRDISRAQMRKHAGLVTLAATELANEAYERLHRQRAVEWQNRDHFYAIAATVIRRVIVDHIRQRSAEKRGGEIVFVGLDEAEVAGVPATEHGVDWLALDQALNELASVDAEVARVVELRFFSGLSVEQIATVNASSTATVGRQWRFARAWLAQRLDAAGSAPQ